MTFAEFVGRPLAFYGVDGTRFRLGEPGKRPVTFEAVEDPEDGYRSMMDEVKLVTGEPPGIYFATAIAAVVPVESPGDVDGYDLVDIFNGHVWLRFGTNDRDEYYPTFVFDYVPSGAEV